MTLRSAIPALLFSLVFSLPTLLANTAEPAAKAATESAARPSGPQPLAFDMAHMPLWCLVGCILIVGLLGFYFAVSGNETIAKYQRQSA